MKKLSKLTLKDIEEHRMSQLEMNAITGGTKVCGCACSYSSTGGSSTADNSQANRAYGYISYGMWDYDLDFWGYIPEEYL